MASRVVGSQYSACIVTAPRDAYMQAQSISHSAKIFQLCRIPRKNCRLTFLDQHIQLEHATFQPTFSLSTNANTVHHARGQQGSKKCVLATAKSIFSTERDTNLNCIILLSCIHIRCLFQVHSRQSMCHVHPFQRMIRTHCR